MTRRRLSLARYSLARHSLAPVSQAPFSKAPFSPASFLQASLSQARFATAGAIAIAFLGGCTSLLLPGTLGERPTVTLEVRQDFRPARSARSVQAVLTPYASADVNHLVVKVFKVAGNTETQATGSSGVVEGDIQGQDLGKSLVFAGLHHSTSYRVRGYAYRSAGAQSADLISDTGSSYFDITVTDDDRPAVATLSVQLIDRKFSGAGTSSIEIKTGTVEQDTSDVAIQVGSQN